MSVTLIKYVLSSVLDNNYTFPSKSYLENNGVVTSVIIYKFKKKFTPINHYKQNIVVYGILYYNFINYFSFI